MYDEAYKEMILNYSLAHDFLRLTRSLSNSRSAVIRGRVVTHLGTGLMGVRVSTSTPLEGFTLTRDDGWFDLLVNGGGAVTLQFGRSPFKPQSHIVFVPWNEVSLIFS